MNQLSNNGEVVGFSVVTGKIFSAINNGNFQSKIHRKATIATGISGVNKVKLPPCSFP